MARHREVSLSTVGDVRSAANRTYRRSAERVAREIELDIVGNQLAAGDWIGSEAELMERFSVSRGVIREAVALVEHHMLAQTRRGAGGGLVVIEPDASVITEITSLYLARKRVSVADLLETRVLLEGQALALVMVSRDEGKLAALRAETLRPMPDVGAVAQEALRFHVLLAELSGNGVMEMIVPILSGLVKEVWSATNRRPTYRQEHAGWLRVTGDHARIVDAMEAGDLYGARRALEEHLLAGAADLAASIAPLALAAEV